MNENKIRILRGRSVCNEHACLVGNENEPLAVQITDLLVDLMHYADAEDVETPWSDLVMRASMHFEEEQDEVKEVANRTD